VLGTSPLKPKVGLNGVPSVARGKIEHLLLVAFWVQAENQAVFVEVEHDRLGMVAEKDSIAAGAFLS
jgi:hypothetical protein